MKEYPPKYCDEDCIIKDKNTERIVRTAVKLAIQRTKEAERLRTTPLSGRDLDLAQPSVVQEAVASERKRIIEIIENMKIDIMGNCAYQGADLPKKWLKNEVPLMQQHNRTLEDLKQKIKEPEKEVLK